MIRRVIRSSPWPLQRNSRGAGVWLIRSSDGSGFSRSAAWPSGKAEDCKSFIPSSNLGAALVVLICGLIVGTFCTSTYVIDCVLFSVTI